MGLFDQLIENAIAPQNQGKTLGTLAGAATGHSFLANLGGQVGAAIQTQDQTLIDERDALTPASTSPFQTEALVSLGEQEAAFGEQVGQQRQSSDQDLARERASIQKEIDEISRKRKNLETGTAFTNDIQRLEQAQSTTQRNILSAGGSSAGAIQGLALTQQAVSQGINDLLSQSFEQDLLLGTQSQNLQRDQAGLTQFGIQNQGALLNTQLQGSLGFEGAQSQVRNRIEQRELDLELFLRAEKSAQIEGRKQFRFDLFNSIVGGASSAATSAAAGI